MGMLFINRWGFRFAEYRRRGRKNEAFYPVPEHGIQQVLGVGDIATVITGRFPHGFAHLTEGGEVHDGGNAIFGKYPVE